MKRIHYNIAVEALIAVIKPDVKLLITDRQNMYDKGTIVYDDICGNLNQNKYVKILKSKIVDLNIKDDYITIAIETVNEKY